MGSGLVLRRRWLLALLVVPVLSGVAVGATFAFSSSGSSSAAHSGGAVGHGVSIMNFSFSPSPLTAAPGATITVTNGDGTAHTVTSTTGRFDTGDISGGSTATFVAPTQPGTYQYRCSIHQYMHGVLVVR